VDLLDEALPGAAPREVEGDELPWREGSAPTEGAVGFAAEGDRAAVATEEEVVIGPRPDRLGEHLVVHDAKALRVNARDDTLLAAYLIEPGRATYLLDDLGAEYGVGIRPSPEADEETAALIRRAALPPRLIAQMRARLLERGNLELYETIELPLGPVLADMEDAGVRIDTYRMGEITARLQDRVEELESKAYELAGEEFMLGSTQQVAGILFEKLHLTPGRKGKTGYSTDTRVLRTIRSEHELVGVIEEWRELSKLINTYLGPLPTLIGEDGRLHTTINQAVAATGRLSTSNPNLQAIPIRTELGREIRSAFVAEPGHKLVSADYSQIELRILAHVSGEPKLREAFERGEDIHTATAAEVLGVEPARLTKGDRSIAKMINFGIVYGISAFGLSENLEIPREQAQAYIDAYLARFPHVQDFIARTIEEASRDGYVTSLLGRRRPVPEIRASNRQTRSLGERLAVNFVMQGSNADIIKVAMIRIHRRLRDEGRSARLVLQVHDELLLEAPDAEVAAVKDIVKAEMCGAYDLDPPLAVDVGTGPDWTEAKG
jgi:DNA polymerase-1